MSSYRNQIQGRFSQFRHKRNLHKAIQALRPNEFYYRPEPPTPGDYAIGLRLLNGEIFQENQIHNLEAGSIWDYRYPSEYFVERMHAFDWMDDLASVKTAEADRKIRAWAQEWIKRYGRGDGMGWSTELIGWRLIRLITHATTILAEAGVVEQERYFETLGIQINYMRLNMRNAREGLPRFVSLVGWLYASLSLDQFEEDVSEVIEEIDQACANLVDQNDIFLDSRNPEELSQIFCLLVWADQLMEDADEMPGRYQNNAIDVLGRAVRALRFADRDLLPANGGGTGRVVEIDRALSAAQIQGASYDSNILGFRNIRAGGLNVFFDCFSPPSGLENDKAHASTLGLWVAERNQVLICAGGAPNLQPLVKRVERQETMHHSTTVLNDRSSSTLALKKDPNDKYTIGATISNPAQVTDFEYHEDTQSINIRASHEGYRQDFGYVHERKLLFDRDGLYFGGIDILSTQTPKDEKRVKDLLGKRQFGGVPVDIYFHLGPKVEPVLNMNNSVVSFRSEMGHLWIFRQEGGKIELVDSEYFHSNRIAATPTKSIVIRTQLGGASGYVTWSFQAYPDE